MAKRDSKYGTNYEMTELAARNMPKVDRESLDNFRYEETATVTK